MSIPLPPMGLYIHIPFCLRKCAYCDFNSYSGLGRLAAPYVRAVQQEAERWSAIGRRYGLPNVAAVDGKPAVGTVYFGGGTPTSLKSEQLAEILYACRRAFAIEPEAEITVEANPGTVDERKLAGLLAAGVNRLSMGVQSYNPRLLKLLGRIHSSGEALRAVSAARQAGFSNISLDLIYGLPTQTNAEWQEDIERAIDLSPEHLSLYGLIVEEGTPLASSVARGLLPPPDLDLAAEMYVWAGEALGARGYEHYEISNWARRGAGCRHNLTYWRNQPYLGLGAGAHSSFCSLRLSNVTSPQVYIDRLTVSPAVDAGEESGFRESLQRSGAVEEVLDIALADQMAETAFLGLRTAEGLDCAEFCERFGVPLEAKYGQAIANLIDLALLQRTGNCVSLTPRGRLLGNEVFVRFLDA